MKIIDTFTAMSKLLSIENLKLNIKGREVLNISSLQIFKNSIVLLTGESGSGKSLLAKCILGISPDTFNGVIAYKDKNQNIKSLNVLRGKEIAYIPQSPISSFDPIMTIGKQMEECISNNSYEKKEICLEALKNVNLNGESLRIYNSFPHQLSGGQLQRVLVAIALLNKPNLIIADEANSSIDTQNEKEIFSFLKSYCKENGATLIWIAHHFDINLFDHVISMKHGQIVDNSKNSNFQQSEYLNLIIRTKYKREAKNDSNSSFSNPLVTLQNVSFSYGDNKIFQDFSLCINRNERVGIVGESGKGKTTLGKLISSQLRDYKGSITWHIDSSIKTQVIFQIPIDSFNPKQTIRESLLEPYKLNNLYYNEQLLIGCLNYVKLDKSLLDKYPKELSDGQLQRVAITRALVLKPELLILDEAFSSLDNLIKTDILYLLDEISELTNMAFLMISHHEETCSEFCDTVYRV